MARKYFGIIPKKIFGIPTWIIAIPVAIMGIKKHMPEMYAQWKSKLTSLTGTKA